MKATKDKFIKKTSVEASILASKDDAIKAVGESISKLTQVIEKKELKVENNILPKVEKIDYNELIKQIGGKIDILADAISNRPTAFEFDLKRHPGGGLYKVIVKPVK